MNCTWKWCAILFLATGALAQTSAAPKAAPKARKPRASTVTAADVQALRDAIASQTAAIAAQHQEIEQLRDELHRKDQVVNQVQAGHTDAARKGTGQQPQTTQTQESA